MFPRALLAALAAAASLALGVSTASATQYLGFNEPGAMAGTFAASKEASLLASAGATSTRFVIDWSWVEKTPGTYAWSVYDAMYNADLARGIRPLIGIVGAPSWAYDPSVSCSSNSCGYPPGRTHDADWTDIVTRLAARYPSAAAIEVWNEPNLLWEWNGGVDPERFTELLGLAYNAVKAVNPSMPVLLGGLAGMSGSDSQSSSQYGVRSFLNAVYSYGGRPYFDGIAVHAYPHSTQLYRSFAVIAVTKETAIANGDGDKPIWITEFGLPTRGPEGFTEYDQATVLPRLVAAWRADSSIAGLYVHQLVDDVNGASTQQQSFGALHSDLSPKPAFCSLSAAFGGTYSCPPTVAPAVPTGQQSRRWQAQALLGAALDAALRYHRANGTYLTLTSAALHALDARLSSAGGLLDLPPGAAADPSRIAVLPASNGDGVMLCNTSQADRSYCVRTYWRARLDFGNATGTIRTAANATVNHTSTSW